MFRKSVIIVANSQRYFFTYAIQPLLWRRLQLCYYCTCVCLSIWKVSLIAVSTITHDWWISHCYPNYL